MIIAKPFPLHSQRGMTLVEIMIAVTIGLILTAGVIQLFISNKVTYTLAEGQARIQENARFATAIISRDLRMAGYMGCGNSAMQGDDTGTPQIYVNNLVRDPDPNVTFDLDATIRGVENATSGEQPSIVPGSDTVTIRRASEQSANLTGNMTARNANIQIDSNPAGWEAGDVIFITDCQNADIFKATSVSSGAGKITIAHANNVNIDNKLSREYDATAMVLSFIANTYYVADTGRTNKDGEAIHSLYYTDVNNDAVELIEGIGDMQVTYGVNTDGGTIPTVDSYVDANGVANWADVVSVRLALLVDSIENVTDQKQSYNFEGVQTTADDRRLRRSFTTTIALRNRTP